MELAGNCRKTALRVQLFIENEKKLLKLTIKKKHITPLGSNKMLKESFRIYEFLLWVCLPKRHTCLNNP